MAEHECTCTNCGGREHCKNRFEPSRKCCCFWEPELKPIWISCSERLPENNVPVLYVWRGQSGAVAVLHGWHFEIRSLGSAWHQSGVGIHRPDEEVTHWMPLPEPPNCDTQMDADEIAERRAAADDYAEY